MAGYMEVDAFGKSMAGGGMPPNTNKTASGVCCDNQKTESEDSLMKEVSNDELCEMAL